MEDKFLHARESNFLTAIFVSPAQKATDAACSIAWADLSTGEFFILTCPATSLLFELSRISPSEILISSHPHQTSKIFDAIRTNFTTRERKNFSVNEKADVSSGSSPILKRINHLFPGIHLDIDQVRPSFMKLVPPLLPN